MQLQINHIEAPVKSPHKAQKVPTRGTSQKEQSSQRAYRLPRPGARIRRRKIKLPPYYGNGIIEVFEERESTSSSHITNKTQAKHHPHGDVRDINIPGHRKFTQPSICIKHRYAKNVSIATSAPIIMTATYFAKHILPNQLFTDHLNDHEIVAIECQPSNQSPPLTFINVNWRPNTKIANTVAPNHS